MLNKLFHKNVILALSLVACVSVELIAKKAAQHAPVTIERVMNGSLEREKDIFVRAFKGAYEGVSLETLKVADLDSFLDAAFADEPADLNNPAKQVFCFVAKHEKDVVGVIFYEQSEDDKGVVYVRQLAVDPAMQNQGIGQKLMSTITQELSATTKKIVLATRRVNKQARNFYEKQGFKECEKVPHGLNPERYVGFEKNLK